MLRIAAAEDLTALTRLRRAATGDSAEDAAGWLQRVAGLENILLLEKPGAPPALMLAAVPVHYAHRKGIWFTGLAADKGVPADKLLPRLLEGALRAFAENGCDFAVMTPDTAADASKTTVTMCWIWVVMCRRSAWWKPCARRQRTDPGTDR